MSKRQGRLGPGASRTRSSALAACPRDRRRRTAARNLWHICGIHDGPLLGHMADLTLLLMRTVSPNLMELPDEVHCFNTLRSIWQCPIACVPGAHMNRPKPIIQCGCLMDQTAHSGRNRLRKSTKPPVEGGETARGKGTNALVEMDEIARGKWQKDESARGKVCVSTWKI